MDMSLRKGSIEARGLTVRIGGASIVRDVDLTIGPGDGLGLVGRSGSGKSTLARALVGLEDQLADTPAASPELLARVLGQFRDAGCNAR